MRRMVGIVGALSCALWMAPAVAQEGVEDRIKILEEQLKKQKEELEALRKKVEEVAEAPVLRQPFHFKIFSGITASFDNQDHSENSIVLGETDLFAQADLGKGLSALIETVFEADDEDNDWEVDQERILLSYAYSDAVAFSAGKFHVPIGYWNDEYHHGAYLHAPIHRPRMIEFEDEDGFFPAHGVGFALSGKIGLPLDLYYDAYVVNGRGRETDEVLNVSDNNGAKGVGGKLEFRGIPCSRVGLSFYRDTVDAEPAPGTDVEFRENIYACHLVCDKWALKMIAEAFLMDHDGRDLDREQETNGGYVMVSYELDELTPFVLWERINFAGDDPYLAERRDVSEGSAGIRWDFHPNAAVKLEYHHTELRNDETPGTDERYGTVLMNISFFF